MPIAALAAWRSIGAVRSVGARAASRLGSPRSCCSWRPSTCLLIYSIRRHRIDDFRGRYRVWLAAAVACVVLSADSVAGLHDALAQSLSHHTGWTALRAAPSGGW